jgi:DNA polymerase-3 subunit epsilon
VSGGYAVLDLETTGLFPGGHDRVVEIAVVHLDESGLPGESFATLVNPERDIGPTRIHGLSAADVLAAPVFREIGGEVLRRLRGRVVVGHNVSFDRRFLAAEFGRMNQEMPPFPSLCTMQLVRRLGAALPDHRLTNCCAALGIPHEAAHSALGDALATAALFREIWQRSPSAVPTELLDRARAEATGWPVLEILSSPLPRADARRRMTPEESLIGSLVSRLPVVGENAESASYHALLERILEDRKVSPEEASVLRELAQDCRLGQDSVGRIHAAYIEGAVRLAAADGVVTDAERHELEEFGLLLGLEPVVVERLIRESLSPRAGVPVADRSAFRLVGESLGGRTVCFTGDLQGTLGGHPITRETAQALATNAGLMVAKSVTKRLDLLVVADPDSQSSKARKAREYGTRIMVESVFWRSIGAPVD